MLRDFVSSLCWRSSIMYGNKTVFPPLLHTSQQQFRSTCILSTAPTTMSVRPLWYSGSETQCSLTALVVQTGGNSRPNLTNFRTDSRDPGELVGFSYNFASHFVISLWFNMAMFSRLLLGHHRGRRSWTARDDGVWAYPVFVCLPFPRAFSHPHSPYRLFFLQIEKFYLKWKKY